MKTLISIVVVILTVLVASQPVESQTLKQTSLIDSNVTLVGHWPNGPCHSAFVVGDYAYIGNGAAIDIIDVSTPSSPIRIGQVIMNGVVQGIHVSGDYA